MNTKTPTDPRAARICGLSLLATCLLWCSQATLASATPAASHNPGLSTSAALRGQLVDQREFHPQACGPCAMYHALLFGGPTAREVLQSLPGNQPQDKVGHLIRTYGALPSTMRVAKPMLHERGMHWQDAGVLMNAVLHDHGGPTLASGYLQREPDDDHLTHLRKVHRLLAASLEAGWPPVISLRGYVARHDARRGGVVWQDGRSHYVALIELGDLAHDEDSGFMFRYIESFRAGRQQGFVHIERQRDFQAQTTFGPLGEWVGDAPFLTVTAPFMRMIETEAPLHLRSVVTLHHAIVFRAEDHGAPGGPTSPSRTTE